MSRIGNAPIEITKDITIQIQERTVSITGPKGTAQFTIPAGILVESDGTHIIVKRLHNDRPSHALHGFVRAELANEVTGVRDGWKKILELSGVGYRATMSGVNLVLSVGFSHQVTIEPVPGISFAIVDTKIVVSGINKQLVGQIAANIRAVRKPEPYKGKGIKYQGEHIRKKAGKSAKAVGGGK